MLTSKVGLTQEDFVGGLFHALMVSYDETVKAQGEQRADEWLILHDMILSLAFLAAGLEAGERDKRLRDVLDEFHGKVAAGMLQAGVPARVVSGYEQKRAERFREYNPLVRKAGGRFASDAELELGRAIANNVGKPERPVQAYVQFTTTFSTTKGSLDRMFSRNARLDHSARRLLRQTISWVRRGTR